MAKKLYFVLTDSDSINEEELRECGVFVSLEIDNESLASNVEKVLGEVKDSSIGADIQIKTMNGKIVEMKGPSLNNMMLKILI